MVSHADLDCLELFGDFTDERSPALLIEITSTIDLYQGQKQKKMIHVFFSLSEPIIVLIPGFKWGKSMS